MTSEEDCIRALREAADRLGGSPTKAADENLGLTPGSATTIRVMGGWNAAKEPAGLETYPSRGSRVGPKPEGVDIPDDETWEEMSVDQRWHYRNADWNTERTLERRADLRAWVYRYKRDSDGCARCGATDPARLDFHHRDSEEKDLSVGSMVSHGYSRERIHREIEKCVILCANCHRKEHYEVPPGIRSDETASTEGDRSTGPDDGSPQS